MVRKQHKCRLLVRDATMLTRIENENISASGTSRTRAFLGAHDAEENLSLMFPCATEQFSIGMNGRPFLFHVMGGASELSFSPLLLSRVASSCSPGARTCGVSRGPVVFISAFFNALRHSRPLATPQVQAGYHCLSPPFLTRYT